MQLNLLKEEHIDFLAKEFQLSEDDFRSMCERDGEDLDKLLDDLLWKECDAAEEFEEKGEYSPEGLCAIELIDIICGPYDEKEINDYLSKED